MATALEGKNILLVDDDPDMLTALQTVLDGSGATIETAADGNAAIELAVQFNPDLVVLDAMLPKRSGFLVLEKLKGGKKDAKPYIIMITANEGSRHKAYAEYLGVVEYIRKPFAMEKLMEAVQRGLSGKPAEGEEKADEQ